MNDIKVSKKISYLLRHKEGYTNSDGFVSVEKLINDVGIDLEDLKRIVREDNKQRYSFNLDLTKIRANQGHSTGVSVELQKCMPPEVLYHGTSEKFLIKIQDEGIKRMSRDYVHLSTDVQTAISVGKRHGKSIVLEVDTTQMYKDDIEFFISDNGVWLTKFVDKKYIKKVIK